MAVEKLDTKVITGKARLSYAYLFEPRTQENGEDRKYSVSLIIPKSDTETISRIKRAVENAKKNGKSSKFDGKIPKNLKTPLRDGDTDREDQEEYANSFFINCSCKTRPGVVDKNMQPIIDPEEVYSGCYALVSVTLYPFNSNGSKGIAAGLNNVMKIADGEPLGGRVSAEVDFAEVDLRDYDVEDDDLL